MILINRAMQLGGDSTLLLDIRSTFCQTFQTQQLRAPVSSVGGMNYCQTLTVILKHERCLWG